MTAETKSQDLSEIELNGCDDFHVHLRNEESLALLVEHCSIQVERALVMPNTKPPILTVSDAQKYYDAIVKHVPPNQSFEPLMSLYLTDSTTLTEVDDAAKSKIVYAFKLYPKNATTNSTFGVTNIKSPHMKAVFECMQKNGLILCVHGECNIDDQTKKFIDIFEREHAFLDNELNYIITQFPTLKVILEHVTTKKAVDFIMNYYAQNDAQKVRLAATITAHHLLNNRNAIFENNKVNPHMFCLPILKTESDQNALIGAALSGLPYFFAGSDSAPHTKNTKECSHGCAGIYTGYNTVALYAETFHRQHAMHKMNAFMSQFGAAFYNIPQNKNKVKLVRQKHKIPKSFLYIQGDTLVPFKAGDELNWCLQRQLEHKYVAENKYATL